MFRLSTLQHPLLLLGVLLAFIALLVPASGDEKKPEPPKATSDNPPKKPEDPQTPPSPPPYRIAPPDVLHIQSLKSGPGQSIGGKFVVRPDGTISLGVPGTVKVAGLTVEEARKAIAATVLGGIVDLKKTPPEQLLESIHVEVVVSAANVFYVVIENRMGKDRIVSLPVTGKDTVLDAMARIGKCKRILWRKMQIVRPAPDNNGRPRTLVVDWQGILRGESLRTNFQLLPGDILVVADDEPARE